MSKMPTANLKELVLLPGTENLVVKVLVEPLSDIGEIPFHFMNLSIRPVDFYLFVCGFFP